MPASRAIVREPAVAGRFYPGSARELAADVAELLALANPMPDSPSPGSETVATAVMAPHAGYVYSGGVAGHVFGSIAVPKRVIVLCPNHTGQGPRVSVASAGTWRIPGAEVAIDHELAAALLAAYPDAQADHEAHRYEHAIEVELPFLVARQPDLRIVPVVLGGLRADTAIGFGEALGRAVRAWAAQLGTDTHNLQQQVLLVASSDMSHYLPDAQARQVDREALSPLLAFDPTGLHRTVVEREISMCGVVPATAMLSYARMVGAQTPELVAYATSAEAFGDTSRVVGYAGVILTAPDSGSPHPR